MDSIKKQARRAGLLYFLIGVTAPISFLLVPSKLLVDGDATATADRIRASESLFRLGIGCELFHQVVVVFLVLALYRLFKPVNESHARQVVILGALVSVPIMFANVLNEIATLIFVSGTDFLKVFDKPVLDAFAYLFVRLHSHGITLASIFWGLWLFPFAMLVIRSGFIPRILGVLMIIAGIGYLMSAFATLLVPSIAGAVGRVAMILEVGELPIMFWLLIWGAREQRTAAPAV